MVRKIFLILSLISITIVGTLAQASNRGPRGYGQELPTSRTGRPVVISSEPSGCSKCLSDNYLAHYFQMNCTPKTGELWCNKPCWKYFECPKQVETKAPEGCEYKGNVYKIGEDMPDTNPCKQNCYCEANYDDKNTTHPKKVCANVDCFESFRDLPPNCYGIYEEGQCCAKKFCANEEQAKVKCKIDDDGQEYSLNISMTSRTNPCFECQCNERWNQSIPLNENNNCKRIECDLQNEPRLKKGCIPIYYEGVCCPVSYHCPPPEEHQCKFDGKRYNIGEKIEIGYNDRTECTCMVPPIFTCIERSSKSIRAKLSQPEVQVEPLKPIPLRKPKQELPKQSYTSTTTPSSSCPPYIEGGLTCAGVNCTTIIDINGCQACHCQKPCPLLKCRSNCFLTATTPGVCPKCQCTSRTLTETI